MTDSIIMERVADAEEEVDGLSSLQPFHDLLEIILVNHVLALPIFLETL